MRGKDSAIADRASLVRNDEKKAAFTLAEVLITLGIIGVVAAVTIPALIANYQKHQTVVRLKKAYSTISQALTRAQVDYGDFSIWDSLSDVEDIGKNITLSHDVETYILPYLTNVLSAKLTSLDDIGYASYVTVDGKFNTNLWSRIDKKYIIEMSDATTYWFSRNFNGNMLIYIDINGIKRKNVWGKDAFIFNMVNNKFLPYVFSSSGETREAVLNGCKTDGRTCGALIMMDGWQIKDDYPIRF